MSCMPTAFPKSGQCLSTHGMTHTPVHDQWRVNITVSLLTLCFQTDWSNLTFNPWMKPVTHACLTPTPTYTDTHGTCTCTHTHTHTDTHTQWHTHTPLLHSVLLPWGFACSLVNTDYYCLGLCGSTVKYHYRSMREKQLLHSFSAVGNCWIHHKFFAFYSSTIHYLWSNYCLDLNKTCKNTRFKKIFPMKLS